MEKAGLVTVALVTMETAQLFHVRNAFAAEGVVEDPATGAAAAAFAGYLRDIGWPHGGAIDIVQGEDMGPRSLIRAEISETAGSSIRVSGTARFMDDAGLPADHAALLSSVVSLFSASVEREVRRTRGLNGSISGSTLSSVTRWAERCPSRSGRVSHMLDAFDHWEASP
ncbi:PhzF family phenazine biosynthesis protein [Bradyrhizobium sp. 186]|uniref:PhzF family phenazine biosynthesis protein n=1 Tax=Bradyrhizobium sp. 186 TaxID=2782654 RepID=UPI002062DCF2|nr:PhzF family phenazine biosynthesis protein [Bradyrhizobium sp. 186]